MTRTGNTGKVLTDVEGCFHNNFFKIHYDKSALDKYFLYYLFNTTKTQKDILAGAGASTIPDLNHNAFFNIESYISNNIKEQKKIGEMMKYLDNLITFHQRKYDTLLAMKDALIDKMFPSIGNKTPNLHFKKFNEEWKITNFGELFDFERPDPYMVSNDVYEIDGIPVLTANKAFVLGYKNENNFYNKGECIIFDDFTLDCKYVNFPFKVNSSAIKILTAKKDEINFLYYLISQSKFLIQGHSRHYISIVQPTQVYVPNLNEQKKIGGLLENVDNLITLHQRKLKKLQDLKKALSEKMFL